MSFTSDILQPNEVTDYLVRLIQPRLTTVSGVQKADILGGRTFAMRVWMKPERMATLGISAKDVRDALSKNNYLAAIGSTKGSLVQVSSRLALAGLHLLLLALTGAVLLALDDPLGRPMAVALAAGVFLVLIALWVVLPMRIRAQHLH